MARALRTYSRGMTTNNGYENAPATKLLATHCICCNRPLLDATSVELGIGPDCRKKYMGKAQGHDDAARREANALVHRLALAITSSGTPVDLLCGTSDESAMVTRIRELGFDKLADKLVAAWMPIRIVETDSMLVVKSPYNDDAVAAARAIPGRRWNGEEKCNEFPASQRPAVWNLLRRFYAGIAGMGPKGPFVVPAL